MLQTRVFNVKYWLLAFFVFWLVLPSVTQAQELLFDNTLNSSESSNVSYPAYKIETSSTSSCALMPDWTVTSIQQQLRRATSPTGSSEVRAVFSPFGFAYDDPVTTYPWMASSQNTVTVSSTTMSWFTFEFEPVYLPDLCEAYVVEQAPDGLTGLGIFLGATIISDFGARSLVAMATSSVHALRIYGYQGEVGFDASTRIMEVTPADNETVATSTAGTSGVVVNVNEDDFEEGMYVLQKWVRQSDTQTTVNVEVISSLTERRWYLATSGVSEFSTTTNNDWSREGRYTLRTELRQESWVSSFLALLGITAYDPGLLAATTTAFTVGQLSAYDILLASSTQAIEDYVASSTVSLSSCTSWVNFGLIDCLTLLLYPQGDKMAEAFNNIKDGFLSYVPFGYVTRTAAILASEEITPLPDLTYTFADDLGVPVLEGTTLTFSPWSYFYVEGSPVFDTIKSTGADPKTFWDILYPVFATFVWLGVGMQIFSELTGMGLLSWGQRKTDGHVPDETYRYKEKLYAMSQRDGGYREKLREMSQRK